MNTPRRAYKLMILYLLILLVLANVCVRVTFFEDGSWMLYPFRGCLPWAICNL